MSDNTKMLIGILIALNLALVGVLLFRERSVAPASAQQPAGYSENAIPTAVEPRPVAAMPVEVATQPAPSQLVSQVESTTPQPAPVSRVEPIPTQVSHVHDVPATHQRPSNAQAASRPESRPRVESRPVRTEPAANQPEETVMETSSAALATPEVPPMAPAPVVERPRPRPVMVTVAAGRAIPIRLDVRLHSRQVRSGDNFEASIVGDIEVDGKLVASAGSPVTGRVVDVTESGRVKGVERMRLTLNEITLAGKTYPVSASIVELSAEDSKDRDTKMVGAATAVGAIIGAISKGKKGAAAGAATGAAAGAGAVLATRGEAVVLESGSKLDFVLTEAVRVTLPVADDDLDLAPTRVPEPKPVEVPGVVRR